MTPYEASFGQKARVGLGTDLPRDFLAQVTTGMMEEEFEEMLEVFEHRQAEVELDVDVDEPTARADNVEEELIVTFGDEQSLSIVEMPSGTISASDLTSLTEVVSTPSVSEDVNDINQLELDNLIRSTRSVLGLQDDEVGGHEPSFTTILK